MIEVKQALSNHEGIDIKVGEPALDMLRSFIEGRYTWLVSGIDWRQARKVARTDYSDLPHKDVGRLLDQNPGVFGKHATLYFYDADLEVALSGEVRQLVECLADMYAWGDYFFTEFWLFDEATRALIEVYHEGYVTLGLPKT
jgi:hypothetical protein